MREASTRALPQKALSSFSYALTCFRIAPLICCVFFPTVGMASTSTVHTTCDAAQWSHLSSVQHLQMTLQLVLMQAVHPYLPRSCGR